MNVLMLSWRDPKHPLAGGAEQVMHEHAKGWIQAGHKVTLFSSMFAGGKKEDELDSVKIIRKGFQLLGVQICAFFWYIKNKKFDLVIDQFHGIPFFTPLYVNAPKLAVLQEVAKEVWFLNHLPKPLNWLVGGIGFIIEPFFFVPYKKVPFLVGSNSAKNDLVTIGINSKHITVIPHGVITEKIKNFPKEKKITILFLGALARDKGIEDALKTFSILKNKGTFQFWVIGKGSEEYLSFLKKEAKCLEIEESTTFWGFVSQTKKIELLKKAHILINPSIREGWGLVNIEANTMGTPVVAYNSPGLVDSVKHGVSGIICSQNTPTQMAKDVMKVLEEKNYTLFSKNSIIWSENFSWGKASVSSLKLIERISKT